MPELLTLFGMLLKDLVTFVSYVKNNAFPQPLPPDQEQKYLDLLEQGDPEARNILIEHNLRLVAHIVKRI